MVSDIWKHRKRRRCISQHKRQLTKEDHGDTPDEGKDTEKTHQHHIKNKISEADKARGVK